ncbi:hypothetical protein DRE_01902 [Drechslerella stenobrocha 248]|uniref:Histidine kinase n=1 Tax=Drechslerella stenobrocha 248 TaxID=1043628 RepID=W7IHF7_9PEZI|nr:hypothetical protein DRE_01902 [Drechslerella stenobrocha 248]
MGDRSPSPGSHMYLASAGDTIDRTNNNSIATAATTTTSQPQPEDGQTTLFDGIEKDGDSALGRTRKLSIASFTSVEYNRNDDWNDCDHVHADCGNSPQAPRPRLQQGQQIAEEPSSSPSVTSSNGYSSSSDDSCDSSTNKRAGSNLKHNCNNNTATTGWRRRRRQAKSRTINSPKLTSIATADCHRKHDGSVPAPIQIGSRFLSRKQPPQSSLVAEPQSRPSIASDPEQSQSNVVQTSHSDSVAIGDPQQNPGVHCLFPHPTPSPFSPSFNSVGQKPASIAPACSALSSNRDIHCACPNKSQHHSLTYSSGHQHHDHHLHKRRRRLESELPGIHYLPSAVLTSVSKAYQLPAVSPASGHASLVSPRDRRNTSQSRNATTQSAPTRPIHPQLRSLPTPTGQLDDLFSSFLPFDAPTPTTNRPMVGPRGQRDGRPMDSYNEYGTPTAPSPSTFSTFVGNQSSRTVALSTPAPQELRSLVIPFRDSPPAGLPPVQLEVLQHDPRPTFILGTISSTTTEESCQSSTTIHDLQLEIVYHNDAFSSILPDAAFSTSLVKAGQYRTTLNIVDPRYHRWISSSFANTGARNGKYRPYICPDGIIWTQSAFTCADGARAVLVCGVPLPSTDSAEVYLKKGEFCSPHMWEEAAEAARARESLIDAEAATAAHHADDEVTLVADPELPFTGVMGHLDENCQTLPYYETSEGVPKRSNTGITPASKPPLFKPIKLSTFAQNLVNTGSDSISSLSAPMSHSQVLESKVGSPDDWGSRQAEEQMDTADNTTAIWRSKCFTRNSTVYSPHSPSDYGFFDWTRLPFSILSDPHTELVRQVDWAATGFGAMDTWPQSLRTMINLVISSPHPAAMYWGPDFSIVYNEPYIPLIGAKHPWLLGQKYKDGWSEIWVALEPFFMEAVKTGKPTNKEDDRLFILRNGFREETYFSWSICPIIGEDGTTVGLHNPAFEKTRRVIAERRMIALREVGERCGNARDIKAFWKKVLDALATNPWDAPFAILYSCKKAELPESEVSSACASSLSSTRLCSLEGTIGVPEGHLAAPQTLDLRSNDGAGFSIALREALHVEANIFLTAESGTLPADLMDGINVQGFSEDICTAAVVCPINPNAETPIGFLVLGINPRRPFDEDYRLFIQLLTRQLKTSVASVVLYEEEVRRAQKAARLAALDKVELSHQLALKSKEAEHLELKFTRLAEFAPVGIFIADFQGKIVYHNDMFSEISAHPRGLDVSRWLESVHPEDMARTEASWTEVINGKRGKTWEFRWKTPWSLSSHLGEQVDRWSLFSASPEVDADGMLLGVFGSITNISDTKFAEDSQKRRVKEVVELKRQQDNFVDIASHEMRNPLSAILQGADAILESLERYKDMVSAPNLLDDIESSIDVAQTISLCALHQKRVVDDILTMSKLDSGLLAVTPVDVQPVVVVGKAFKIFEQEAISSETKMTFKIDESYRDLAINWVKLDPARLLQVLINLLTNALKFLRTEPSKSIIVTLGASRSRPSPTDKNNSPVFFSSTREAVDLTVGPDWGDGEAVFLTFSVLDTGKGLTNAEKKNLFQKFSQATVKTEVSYGGSGLGLFICKELVHLQSGAIGVQSEAGRGCVFSFYIKCRRSTRPEVEILQAPVLGSASLKKRDATNQGPSMESGDPKPIKPSDHMKPPAKRASERLELNYTILIVEDNIVNQKLLKRALEGAGCTAYLANHGAEALEAIKKTVYWKGAKDDAQPLSVVLMDVEMPVMDGLTCSKRIRELQAEGSVLGHIPIVAVTANARQAQIDRMFEAGMDDVVSKPYRIAELIPKLHAVVTKYTNPNVTSTMAPEARRWQR